MPRHFEPDKSDTRYKDDMDKRCIHCGVQGIDHYNSQCPECEYCKGTGKIEMDNNGPILPCPICQG